MVQKETKFDGLIKTFITTFCFSMLLVALTLPAVCWAQAEDGGTNVANTVKTRDGQSGATLVHATHHDLANNAAHALPGDSEESCKDCMAARVMDDACKSAGSDPYVTPCQPQ